MQKHLSNELEITAMVETTNDYAFGTKRKDGKKVYDIGGYDTVDKKDGTVGIMYLFEYVSEVDNGAVKKIDISQFKEP